jgi:VanZ family protein
VAGSLSKVNLGPESFQIRLDHILHFGVYFLICLYFLAGQIKGFHLFSSKYLLKFVLLMLLLATVTEVVQLWVPARTFSPMDIVANVTGIVIGVVVIRTTVRHKGLMT